MALRVDFGRMDGATRTPQGGLRVSAFVTRTGVFSYRLDDGTVRHELRHPDEVFNADSLASLEDAPLTDLHHGKVTGKEYKRLSYGHVRNPVRADSFIQATAVIQDAAMVEAVESGKRKELSCGYTCSLEMKSGEYNGEKYDAIQTNIRYNHVALLPVGTGRAGRSVALHMDAEGDITFTEDRTESTILETEVINGITFKVGSPEHVQALRQARADAVARADAADSKATAEKTRADKAEGERDTARAELKTSADRMDSAVDARIALHDKARKVLGKDAILTGKSDRAVMVEVVTKGDSSFKSDDNMTDDYIRGRFEATSLPKSDSIARVRADAESAQRAPEKTGKKTPAQIREDQRKANAKMHETPLAFSKK